MVHIGHSHSWRAANLVHSPCSVQSSSDFAHIPTAKWYFHCNTKQESLNNLGQRLNTAYTGTVITIIPQWLQLLLVQMTITMMEWKEGNFVSCFGRRVKLKVIIMKHLSNQANTKTRITCESATTAHERVDIFENYCNPDRGNYTASVHSFTANSTLLHQYC